MAQLELKIGDKTYNKAWVDNLSSTSQISTDPAGINYGVIPSTGNATMRDINGQIRADIENSVLPISNAPTKVVINGNQIQEHITSNSDYNVIDKELNLQFSDRLSLLDKVTYAGMPLRDYSMTAYEMLDDVIGSYGDYAKEKPINWIKYQNASRITTVSGHNSILVNTSDEWEIIGTPLKVTPEKQYTISYSINVGKAYTTSQGDGIPIQILRSEPTNTDCSSLAIASAFLSKTVSENIGTITFTPTTNIVYLVINFGWASANQTDLLVSINSIKVNGNSFSIAVGNSKCLDFISGSRMVESNLGNRLSAITIPYPYLPPATFRETIEKFCTLAQMTLSLDDDGKIIFCDARPIVKDTEISSDKLVSVPNQYKISNLNKTLFLKNKVDGVDISYMEVKDNVDINTLWATWSSTNNTYTKNTDNTPFGDVYISITYFIGTATIPVKSADNLKKLFGATDFKFLSTGKHTSGKITSKSVDDDGNPSYTYSYTSENTESWTITKFSETNYSGTKTATLQNNSSFSANIVGENLVINFKLPASQEYQYYEMSSTGYIQSDVQIYTAEKFEVSFYGNIREISFNEVDCSSKGIENATNAITIPTSELMQNLSDVEAIRDNILGDYNMGVPTASIDLFCGLKDWAKGEVIKPNDVLQFEDEDGYWRVTGRTFKYNGSPTLSLDLQKQTAIWRYKYGGISSGTISTGDFTADGTKMGTIKLPSHDYIKHPSRFTVSVVFNENGRTFTQEHTSLNSVDAYTYNALGIHFCHCYIIAHWDAGTSSYTADERYDVRAGVARKTYVEKITITSIEQFY